MREKKEINIQIGEQVRIAREYAQLTQEMLAERIDVSPQYISDLERGVVGIALPTLKKLCTSLGVASDQILFGKLAEERGSVLSNLCNRLTEEQFSILLEIINCYVKAVNP
ncbi:MAG: helix-turn-helix domain-containing protein [Ruminococcaceae bacterium]|nr:helix-turn-helix domain-containing protein [Oscillospiraceae bacterium]